MITLPSHRSALLFLFCRFRSAQRLRLTSSASACSSAVQQKPPSVSRAGVSVILPIQRSWLLHMDRCAGGVNPALPDFLGFFRLPHDPLLLSMFRSLFMFFHKREAHRIYPDPANLICLLSRFFHCSLSGQWFVNHLVSLLNIHSARINKRCGAAVVFVCCFSRSSCSGCPSVG